MVKFFFKKNKTKPTFLAFGLFCLCSLMGMSIRPQGLISFFFEGDKFYDAGHYISIALNGYRKGQLAFYPLWPMILKLFGFLIQVPEKLALIGSLIALGLFWWSLGFFYKTLKEVTAPWLALPLLFLYVLNPLSIFHALPFTESLASFLLILILFELKNLTPSFIQLFLWIFLLSLTRPVAVFMILAISIAAIITLFIEKDFKKRKEIIKISFVNLVASVIGYLPYGFYNYMFYGNFWQPFQAQSAWDRKLGLYWNLISNPSSVGGSSQVLFWDLVAFYIPFVFVGIFAFQFYEQKVYSKIKYTTAQWFNLIWTSLFSLGHSLVAFLTYPIFMSLSRHILSLPLFFYSLGILLNSLPNTSKNRKVLGFFIIVSALFLVRWWARYSKNSWIG